jgi:hypothetical protein
MTPPYSFASEFELGPERRFASATTDWEGQIFIGGRSDRPLRAACFRTGGDSRADPVAGVLSALVRALKNPKA